MTGPEIRGEGRTAALAAHALRLGVRLAAPIATAMAGRLGTRRYRVVEREAARAALRLLGPRLALTGHGQVSGGPYLVVPLHESLVDPLLLASLPLPLRFIARDELFEWDAVGDLIRAGGHLSIPVRPTAADLRRLLRACRDAVEEGDSIVVFPQGSVLGIEIAFHGGASWLSRRLGLPLLPVVIAGSHRVWEYPFSPRARRGVPVAMRVLEPIDPSDLAALELLEERMRALALSGAWASPRRFDPARDGYWDGYPFEIAASFPNLAERLRAHRAAGTPPAAE